MDKDFDFICVDCLERQGEAVTLMHVCWNCSTKGPCLWVNKKAVIKNENNDHGKSDTKSPSTNIPESGKDDDLRPPTRREESCSIPIHSVDETSDRQ